MERWASREPALSEVVGSIRAPCGSIAAGRGRPALHRQAHRIEFFLTMNKRRLALALVFSLAFAVSVYAETAVSKKAREIHNSAIVVDTHADTPQRFLDENYDIGSTDPKNHGHISLDKAKAGNLGAEFFSIWVEPETNQGHFAPHPLILINLVYEQAAPPPAPPSTSSSRSTSRRPAIPTA